MTEDMKRSLDVVVHTMEFHLWGDNDALHLLGCYIEILGSGFIVSDPIFVDGTECRPGIFPGVGSVTRRS